MKSISFEDLENLNQREIISEVTNGKYQQYEFVGLLPSNKNYVMLSFDEKVKTIHKTYFTNFYVGNFEPKYIGNLMISQLQNEIETIKYYYVEQ